MYTSQKTNLIPLLKAPVGEICSDIGEMTIDEIIPMIVENDSILEQIPMIKWLLGAKNILSIIQLASFVKKWALFIGPINESSAQITSEENLKKLFENPKDFTKIIEQTVIAIDRYRSENLAKLLGKLFIKTFKDAIFSVEEYNTLIFSIELMHPHLGIKCIKKFYDIEEKLNNLTDQNEKEKLSGRLSDLDFSPLVNTALLKLPKGGSYI